MIRNIFEGTAAAKPHRERSEPAEGGGGSGRASEPRGAKAYGIFITFPLSRKAWRPPRLEGQRAPGFARYPIALGLHV